MAWTPRHLLLLVALAAPAAPAAAQAADIRVCDRPNLNGPLH